MKIDFVHAEAIGRKAIQSVLGNLDLSLIKGDVEWGLSNDDPYIVMDLFTPDPAGNEERISMIAQAYIHQSSGHIHKVIVYGIVIS